MTSTLSWRRPPRWRTSSRIAAGVGGAPLAGFYTHGELARTRGLTGFHNYTLVVMALA